LLRQPLLFLPRALSTVADAQNAIVRLTELFHLPTIPEKPLVIDPEAPFALRVNKATFAWTQVQEDSGDKKKAKDKDRSGAASKRVSVASEDTKSPSEEGEHARDAASLRIAADQPFRVRDISIEVPRGSLVGIVGSFGCGKVFRSVRICSWLMLTVAISQACFRDFLEICQKCRGT
jgi:ATP-binding cassette subfamily C (CFTR/MRP) protein 1